MDDLADVALADTLIAIGRIIEIASRVIWAYAAGAIVWFLAEQSVLVAALTDAIAPADRVRIFAASPIIADPRIA